MDGGHEGKRKRPLPPLASQPASAVRARAAAAGEQAAAASLEQQGYTLLARNLRLLPYGEIDIVAQRDGVTALVEVRARRQSATFGPAIASLSVAKQGRMRRAAEAYLAMHPVEAVRIDLIAVTLDGGGRVVAVEHIEDALQG